MMLPRAVRAIWHVHSRGQNTIRTAPVIAIRVGNRHYAAHTGKLTLRPYQEEAIKAVQDNIAQGHRRLGISLATGSGKTVIFTNLVDRIEPMGKRRQTIVLVHRRELAEQAHAHIKRTHPELEVEIEMGDLKASGGADVTICSVSTLAASEGKRLLKFDPQRIKLILLDECHHAVAKTWLTCLGYFGALEKDADSEGPVVVGVSATMSRFDGLALGKVLDRVVYHKDYTDMVSDNWLAQSRFTTVRASYDLSEVKTRGQTGDFVSSSLSAVVNTEETNELTVRTWIARAEGRKSTLVFCVDVQHANDMCATFRKFGITAHVVTGRTSPIKRKELLDSFRAGEFPVFINVGVFTEGTDIPNIDCVILARPTRSKNLLMQMIGRGMRLHPGKKDCHVIDMVGSICNGIVTTPSLFGLDADQLIENKTPDEMRKVADEEPAIDPDDIPMSSSAPAGPAITDVTITDYDSINDIVLEAPMKYVTQLSKNAWVRIWRARYVLDCPRIGVIRVEALDPEKENPTQFKAYYSAILPEFVTGQKFRRKKPREIFGGTHELPEAIRMADTYVTNRFPRNLILRSASWRAKPASPQQMAYVEKSLGEGWNKDKTYTKGQIADVIARIKNGVKGAAEKAMKEQAKRQKEEANLKKLREKETVRVGPLPRGDDDEDG